MKINAIPIFLCLLAFGTEAQQIVTPKFIQNLLEDPRAVSEITHINSYYFLPLRKDNFSSLGQNLVRNRNGLYIFLQGTGRVYQIKKIESDRIAIVRIDSTVYAGNNFGSVPFSYKDTLYSLGGYGFWKSNGQLRVYIPAKAEWEVVPLNTEIPFQSEYTYHWFWYDIRHGKIFAGYGTTVNQGILKNEQKESGNIDSLAVLDLEKMVWTRLGALNSFVIGWYGHFHNLGSSPWGQMIFTTDLNTSNNLFLLDYGHNKILTATNAKSTEFRHASSARCLFYFRDSTLYIGHLDRNQLDSIRFSKQDFMTANEAVYNLDDDLLFNYPKNVQWKIALSILTIIVFFGLIYYFFSKGKQTKDQNTFPTEGSGNKIALTSLFDAKELTVLQSIHKNSLEAKGTSIEEFNRLLGVSNKAIEIQKKQRSDVIIAINRKYRFANSTTDLLIKKKRLEQDKRSFEYYISYDHALSIELGAIR